MGIEILPRKEYESLKALNISLLLEGVKTMAHLEYRRNNPKDETPAMRLGTATHLRVFEKGEADKRIQIRPAQWDSYRSNLAKDWRDKVVAENGIPLTPDEFEQVEGMSASLAGRPEIAEIMQSPGKSEAALTGMCPDTGVILKGRIDRIGTYQKWPCLFDLKTCGSADAQDFTRHAVDMEYYIRAAWYLDLADLVSLVERRFLIIAIEKDPPYACRLLEFDEPFLAHGRKIYKALLHQYAKAEKEKAYPSYPAGVEYLEMPKYIK